MAAIDHSSFGKGKRPVINVSWWDAQCYAQWLSAKTGKHYRLPTEAQWEYAARAGTTGDYYWDQQKPELYAWYHDNSEDKTHPVGELKPNIFGLFDMSGNVEEWVQDCYEDDYSKAPLEGSAWEPIDCASNYRVLRGGSWDIEPLYVRSAYRSRNSPDTRFLNIGFRLAQD